ncbi:MAG: methylmalonyl-CoA mutase family protein, partial [Candidatus Dormiibacterota bacterium]
MTGERRDVGSAETLAPQEGWQRLALGVLQKSGVLGDEATPADAEVRLRTRVLDGFDVAALYTGLGRAPEPGFPGARPFLRGGGPAGAVTTGWDVRALHDDPEPQIANAAILDDLNGGVTSIWLRFGLDAIPSASLATVLDGVLLDLAPVALDAGSEGPEVGRAFLRLLHERGVAPEAARGTLGVDPLGVLVRTGAPADLAGATRLAVQVARTHPALRTITVDALAYAEVGASDTEELGCSIAAGIAYLRALVEGGLDVDTACRQLEFRYAATQDQWMTIAKLRAARRLWSRVTEVLGASEDVSAQRQHAVAAPTMLTRRNPWVNLLRVGVAAFAAGVAGADAITAMPFDAAIGRSDDLARRLARNTLALLQDEAELSAVVDPAGGSWYVEQLTDELARAAWPWVQEIERLRGRPDALASGLVAERIAKTRTQRIDRLRRRLDPITGVSEFADLGERPVVRVPRRP